MANHGLFRKRIKHDKESILKSIMWKRQNVEWCVLKSLSIYEWKKNVSVFYRNTIRFMKNVLKMYNVFAVAF